MLWQLSTDQWMLSLAFISLLSYICGSIADRIMLSAGFGPMGNSILLLFGAYAGMYAYNVYGFQLNWYPLRTLAVILGSAVIMLITLSAVKRITNI